jgi:MOSC domain-containing protein
MRVQTLCRYPVKSMLGETVAATFVDERGAEGDRRLALVDTETRRVASAKQPRLWRRLLQFSASGDAGQVHIKLPDGNTVAAADPGIDELLSRLLGRSVRLVSQRPQGATLERPDPEKVLELGEDAEVEARIVDAGRLVHRPCPTARNHDGHAGARRDGGAALPAEPGD